MDVLYYFFLFFFPDVCLCRQVLFPIQRCKSALYGSIEQASKRSIILGSGTPVSVNGNRAELLERKVSDVPVGCWREDDV